MVSSVSVIIPVYNGIRYIDEAVQSALDQDHPEKEVVVVDDGSTDGTLDRLRAYGSSIRLIAQKNAGPPGARNNGLRAATGDYVAFLDADDIWLQGKLSRQVAHLDAHQDVGTVLTNWHVWPAQHDGTFVRPAFATHPLAGDELDKTHSGWLYNRLLFDCEMLTTTVMMRASVIREIGDFDASLFNGDDYDYWLRASRIAKISRLKGIGALYRVVPGSVSRKPRETNFEHVVISKAIGRWGLVGPDGTHTSKSLMDARLEQLVLSHGFDHLRGGDPRVALSAYGQTLRRHPLQLSLWVNALKALTKVVRS